VQQTVDFHCRQTLLPKGISATSIQAPFGRFHSIFFTAGTASTAHGKADTAKHFWANGLWWDD
jgi:hypothetical protein